MIVLVVFLVLFGVGGVAMLVESNAQVPKTTTKLGTNPFPPTTKISMNECVDSDGAIISTEGLWDCQWPDGTLTAILSTPVLSPNDIKPALVEVKAKDCRTAGGDISPGNRPDTLRCVWKDGSSTLITDMP